MIPKRIEWAFQNTYLQNTFSSKADTRKFITCLELLLVLVYGLAKIFELFLIQKITHTKSILDIDHLVIESAAPHMHLNYFRHFGLKKTNKNYLIIECYNKNQFTTIYKISCFQILKEFLLAFKEALSIFYILQSKQTNHDIFKVIRTGLPVFAYLSCLFKYFKLANPQIKFFSGGAHLAAAAAISTGIESHWLAHGLIEKALTLDRKSWNACAKNHYISYPRFDCIYLYSNEEAEYLKKYKVASELSLYPYKKVDVQSGKIIIFSESTHSSSERKVLKEIIKLFQQNNHQVVMKLHPSYKGDLDKNILKEFTLTVIRGAEKTALELMTIEKPEFACAFGSTALCEALYSGVIPICIEEKNWLLESTPYPFRKRSIRWSEDQDLVTKFLQNPNVESRNSILQNLLSAK
jgi:hypothetical protein